ncbi:phage portal protein [Pikeienuella piscinae]|uniref:phage portal protein n=1 Tax=Pikeienuella piscinae TaxID=2748098 RepID=UPI001FEBC5EC|nr:phage portal protein [Pikeienuella piscinae]
MAEKKVSVRLAAVGGRQVRAELEGVGEAGARGFGRLSREMETANARMHELDQFEDAALVKAKVAALFTGFITDPDGTAGGLSGTNTGGALTVGMEPGSLIPLPPGADIRFSNPTEHDAYAPFVKNHLRAVAAGLGLPYELVSGDLEGVTYSSIRAGLIEFRRRVEQLQHNVVVHLFCRPVWERFVRLAVLTGELPARDFDRNPDAYLGCEWLPPKFDYVDPMKGRAGRDPGDRRRAQEPVPGDLRARLRRRTGRCRDRSRPRACGGTGAEFRPVCGVATEGGRKWLIP